MVFGVVYRSVDVPKGRAPKLGPHPRPDHHRPTTRRRPRTLTQAAGSTPRRRPRTMSRAVSYGIPTLRAASAIVTPAAQSARTLSTSRSDHRARGASSPSARPAALTAITFSTVSPSQSPNAPRYPTTRRRASRCARSAYIAEPIHCKRVISEIRTPVFSYTR